MDSVAKKSDSINYLDELLRLPRALMGGTQKMREEGIRFLPKERGESILDYSSRLIRSFLFGGFERTIEILVGEVFRKPIVVREQTDQSFVDIAHNVDLKGNNITRFSSDFFRHALFSGCGFILVDTPPLPVDADGNRVQTTAEEDQVLNRRVYWAHIPLSRVLGVIIDSTGEVDVLRQIRIHEEIESEVDRFTTEKIEQIRVLEPGSWEIWRKRVGDSNDIEWYLEDSGLTELDYIPLVPFYTGPSIDYLVTKPPLQGLAELNLAHWQSSSDQTNILHFARVPILFGKGLRRDDKGEIIISPRNLFSTDNPDGDLKFVEHTGAAIGDGWKDLERLEMLMSLWGLELVAGNRPGNVTATEKVLTGAKTGSFLSSLAVELQDVLNSAIEITFEISGIDFDPETMGVEISKDFSLSLFSSETIIKGFQAGIIDRATAIDELKRRGDLSDKVDPIDVAAGIDNDARNSGITPTTGIIF